LRHTALQATDSLSATVGSVDGAAVRDTLARIVESGDYARGVRQTLLARFLSWTGDLWTRLLELAGDSPVVRWAAIAVLGLIVAAVLGRIVWLWIMERRAISRLDKLGGTPLGQGEDPLAAALRSAERGEHAAAVHLLYRALLVRLAGSDRLRLHPAKTAGDYARELRARGSAYASAFREFARAYDRAVYGTPALDAAAWEQLHALAQPMLA